MASSGGVVGVSGRGLEAEQGAGLAGGRVGERRVPPWSCAAHRATARPEAGPSPGGVGAEPLEDALAVVLGNPGATIGDRQRPRVGYDRSDPTREPVGASRAALSTTLTSSCRRRAGSARTKQVVVDLDIELPVRPAATTWAMLSVTCARGGTVVACDRVTPASSREVEEVGDDCRSRRPGRARRRGARHQPARPLREVLQDRDHRREGVRELVGDGGDQVAALGLDEGEVAGHLI